MQESFGRAEEGTSYFMRLFGRINAGAEMETWGHLPQTQPGQCERLTSMDYVRLIFMLLHASERIPLGKVPVGLTFVERLPCSTYGLIRMQNGLHGEVAQRSKQLRDIDDPHQWLGIMVL